MATRDETCKTRSSTRLKALETRFTECVPLIFLFVTSYTRVLPVEHYIFRRELLFCFLSSEILRYYK